MTISKRLTAVESMVALWAFATQGWAWLLGPAVAVGGPMYLAWESIGIAATKHGWWVYPFSISIAMFAVFGFWLLLMHMNGRVRLTNSLDNLLENERAEINSLADRAIKLANELNELIGEYQSRPPTLYDHKKAPDQWQRENWELRNRMIHKFMSKYATETQTILMTAARYLPISERDLTWSFSHIGDHSIGEIRSMLLKTSMELKERLRIPIEDTIPNIPRSGEQRKLSLFPEDRSQDD